MSAISEERQAILNVLAKAMVQQWHRHGAIQLNFICTHNSRRSQMAQAWGHALAAEWQLPIASFSGGVEVTACHPNTLAALLRAGFQVIRTDDGPQPTHWIQWNNSLPLALFSKTFDHPSNPTQNFIAIMTCSEADENCPFIPGADHRIPLRYEDPKAWDGTPEVDAAYDRTAALIRQELNLLFQMTKELHETA
jgi:arsenate reductase